MTKHLNAPFRGVRFLFIPYGDTSYLRQVPAGFPSPATDYMEERIDLVKFLMPNECSSFIIQVTGDSMKDAFIADGSYLVIDRSLNDAATLKSGNIVLAVLNGEFTVKRYVKRGKSVYLLPVIQSTKQWK